MSSCQILKPVLITPPVSEPVTLEEAKEMLRIGSGTADDDLLTRLIRAARSLWEHDTDSYCLTQTLEVTTGYLNDGMRLPGRPLQSITSITYYDANDALQTLSTDVYSLDAVNSEVRLKVNQSWPTLSARWDAVKIRYVAGYTSAALVPDVDKQAMLLMVSHYYENPDMLLTGPMQETKAYDALSLRKMRSTYP